MILIGYGGAASMVEFNAFVDNSPDPWPLIATDRQSCPIDRVDVDGFAYYQVSDTDLIQYVNRNHRIYSNMMGVIPRGPEPEGQRVLEFADPPEHTFHRKLVAKAFSMSKIEERSEQIQAVADDLVDDIVAKGEEFELRRAFGRPLPSTIVAEILGIPVSDREFFMDLSERAEAAVSEPTATEEYQLVYREFVDYIYEQFDERERHPTDDLLSAILHAEVGDQRFTRLEGAALVRLLLGAGNGTTSIAISNTVWLLESNPTEKATLLADPERVAPTAVEEGLRFDCPVLGNFRGVIEETDLGGYRLAPGERVFQLYTAANHDPARYEDPDHFIADRDWSAIPPHFAFGHGIHYCIGAHLARAETTVGLKTLYTRLPNLRVRDGFVPEQLPGIVFRTWKELFMQFDGPTRPRLSLQHGS